MLPWGLTGSLSDGGQGSFETPLHPLAPPLQVGSQKSHTRPHHRLCTHPRQVHSLKSLQK